MRWIILLPMLLCGCLSNFDKPEWKAYVACRDDPTVGDLPASSTLLGPVGMIGQDDWRERLLACEKRKLVEWGP